MGRCCMLNVQREHVPHWALGQCGDINVYAVQCILDKLRGVHCCVSVRVRRERMERWRCVRSAARGDVPGGSDGGFGVQV